MCKNQKAAEPLQTNSHLLMHSQKMSQPIAIKRDDDNWQNSSLLSIKIIITKLINMLPKISCSTAGPIYFVGICIFFHFDFLPARFG